MYRKQLSSLREKLNNRILRPSFKRKQKKRKQNTEISTGVLKFHFKVKLKGTRVVL